MKSNTSIIYQQKVRAVSNACDRSCLYFKWTWFAELKSRFFVASHGIDSSAFWLPNNCSHFHDDSLQNHLLIFSCCFYIVVKRTEHRLSLLMTLWCKWTYVVSAVNVIGKGHSQALPDIYSLIVCCSFLLLDLFCFVFFLLSWQGTKLLICVAIMNCRLRFILWVTNNNIKIRPWK